MIVLFASGKKPGTAMLKEIITYDLHFEALGNLLYICDI